MRWIATLLLATAAFAQTKTLYEGRPAIELANNRIMLTITTTGGAMNRLVLVGDPEKTNPLWEPLRMAREAGEPPRGVAGGHFVCVDGFGPVSAEEKAAGLPGHGEAHLQEMEVTRSGRSGDAVMVSLRAALPLVRERLTRTYTIVDGESVVYVNSELENLLAFDRPVVWAEHATVGSPFLAPELTVTDLSAARSQVRPGPKSKNRRHRLRPGADFRWPMAPLDTGGVVDVRGVPANPDWLDHTTSLMDANRQRQFVTVLHLEKRLLIGYLFRYDEFPWLQTWDNYPASLRMSRGIEFSTQPYDVPRREAISLGRMFGAPTFRWLPAKSKITTRFLLFYVRVPAGFHKVDDVRLDDGRLVIEDHVNDKRVVTPASRGL